MFWPVLSHKARCNAPVLSGTVCSDLISMMHVKIISESRSEPLTAGNYIHKARLLKSYSNEPRINSNLVECELCDTHN